MADTLVCPRCGCGLSRERANLRAELARENAYAVIASLPFTPRERECAELLIEGLSNAEIAEKMGNRYAVTKNRILMMFMKAGCNTRYELMSMLAFGIPKK